MAQGIKDGSTGNISHVDNNLQLHTYAISEDEQRQAAENGWEYNINTGLIAYTGTSESSLLYFKNDEDPVNGESTIIFTGIAFFLGVRSATVTDYALLTVIRNPTGGDIISDATAVAAQSNNNFGSNNTLSTTTLAYKGKDGGTITGGTDHAYLGMAEGRSFAALNMVLPKGSSLGMKVDLNTSGGANVYVAIIGFRKNGQNR
jgi:hypothetical protein